MSEKGVVVSDATSGESVACRDAVELDDDGNSRVIQRVDVCKGQLAEMPDSDTQYDMGYRTMYLLTDTKNLANLPAELTNNKITVGDKSTLVVFVEFAYDATQSIEITPIIFNSAGFPVGQLASKVFSMTQGASLHKGTIGSGSGSGGVSLVLPSEGHTGRFIVPVQTWDVTGAHKIGLHLTTYTGDCSAYSYTLMAWGNVI